MAVTKMKPVVTETRPERTNEERIAALEKTVASLASTVSALTLIVQGRGAPVVSKPAASPAPAVTKTETAPAPKTPAPAASKPAPRASSGGNKPRWNDASYIAAFESLCAFATDGFAAAVIDGLKKDSPASRWYAGKKVIERFSPEGGRECSCVAEGRERCAKCRDTRVLTLADALRNAAYQGFKALRDSGEEE